MESMPAAGYRGATLAVTTDTANEYYVQHHNPFVYFPSLAGELSTHVKPLTSMVADLNSRIHPPSCG